MLPDRKRLRLPGHDYARVGTTFVTVCLAPRLLLLGRVFGDDVELSPLGLVVAEELWAIGERGDAVGLDEWVVMPDHVHALIVVGDRPISVSTVVGAFKSRAAHRVNELRRAPGAPLWQRGFYDHVIRSERDLELHREYIRTNPARWRLRQERRPS